MADATVDEVKALSALTEMLVEVERTMSSLQAARDGILALGSRWALQIARREEHPDFGDLGLRTVAAEFGAALRASDRTVQRRMADASFLVDRFPRIWAAQGAGLISAHHARVIAEAAEHLDDPADREAYASEMIEHAQTESPNRIAGIARRVAERFQKRSIDERHTDARKKRRVWMRDAPDGMAQLGLLGPAALVHGAFDRLTAMARTHHDHDHDHDHGRQAEAQEARRPMPHRESLSPDPRGTDELRTDLALDLLLTGTPAGHDTPDGLLAAITATVAVAVPVTTLIGAGSSSVTRIGDNSTGDTSVGATSIGADLTPAPAELDGRIPIDIATARQLAGTASGWDRVLTHPITGTLLTVDRYRPTAQLRRHLTVRDGRCRFPGCGHSARHSDIDHHHDAALGGRTTHTNLGHLCRRHHTLKHHTPWHVTPGADGIYTWTSPTGHTYTDTPPPPHTVTFTATDTAGAGESGERGFTFADPRDTVAGRFRSTSAERPRDTATGRSGDSSAERPRDTVTGQPRHSSAKRPRDTVARQSRHTVTGQPRDISARRPHDIATERQRHTCPGGERHTSPGGERRRADRDAAAPTPPSHPGTPDFDPWVLDPRIPAGAPF